MNDAVRSYGAKNITIGSEKTMGSEPKPPKIFGATKNISKFRTFLRITFYYFI